MVAPRDIPCLNAVWLAECKCKMQRAAVNRCHPRLCAAPASTNGSASPAAQVHRCPGSMFITFQARSAADDEGTGPQERRSRPPARPRKSLLDADICTNPSPPISLCSQSYDTAAPLRSLARRPARAEPRTRATKPVCTVIQAAGSKPLRQEETSRARVPPDYRRREGYARLGRLPRYGGSAAWWEERGRVLQR
ncbi:hypothetical protein OH77DRAFT_727705 [Trametes cingulata]|nr:hypothetical protein OH77DRAFT_727705 [Trametes cingulata]